MHKFITVSMFALALTLPAAAQDAAVPAPGAIARFIDANGQSVGAVTLTQAITGVHVSGALTGMTPGDHGLHFHETGSCDDATAFESAGGHFNPTEHQHGLDNPDGPHAGDLPNVTAAADGTTPVELDTNLVSLIDGQPGYVFDADGTALVIHAGPDDYKTDPAGNSGDRVACAVIEAAPDA